MDLFHFDHSFWLTLKPVPSQTERQISCNIDHSLTAGTVSLIDHHFFLYSIMDKNSFNTIGHHLLDSECFCEKFVALCCSWSSQPFAIPSSALMEVLGNKPNIFCTICLIAGTLELPPAISTLCNASFLTVVEWSRPSRVCLTSLKMSDIRP